MVVGDLGLIEWVLINLFDNVICYIFEGGCIEVVLWVEDGEV